MEFRLQFTLMDAFSPTDSYLNMQLAMPHIQPMTALALFFLTLARILPIVTLAPFLGTKNVPGTIRLMFGIALVGVFLPQNWFLARTDISFNLFYIGHLIKEAFIGLILGFLSSIPFMIAQMAGGLVDFQRGASSLQVSDPTTQSQTGPMGLLCNFSLIALFYLLGGPFLYFNAIADSYQVLPVDGLMAPSMFRMDFPLWQKITELAGITMRLATQLAAPGLIGVLLTDLFLGIANRLAPQVQIVFLGMALKSWVGIALFTAAWAFMLQVMGKESLQWMQMLRSMIQQIGLNYPAT